MILRPRPSRWLAIWWGGVHGLAAAGLAGSALPAPLVAAGLAALLAHAWGRRPAPPEPLRLEPNGLWAASGKGLANLTLAGGTAIGPFWISLRLVGPGGHVSRLLLRDQLDAEAWRALQAELRRGATGRAD